MKDLYKDNPEFVEIFHSKVHDVRFYAPAENKDYHMSRYAAAGGQNVYAAAGITKELLSELLDKMLEMANNSKINDLRTNIGVICNNLKQRIKYPVDEDCALRMGAILCIAQNEPHDRADYIWMMNKVKMAKGDIRDKINPDPDLYAFFLTMGVEHMPAWKEYDKAIINTEYFRERMESLRNLTTE